MEYNYKCPTKRGYKRIKISNRYNSIIFKFRKHNWLYRYEFYLKANIILVETTSSFLSCVLWTILSPFILILSGLANYKIVFEEAIVNTWFSKKYGSFSSEEIYKKDKGIDETFDKIMKLTEK